MYYIVRRAKDNRPIAGIFMTIKTQEQAQRTLEQWQYNWPNESFYIEEKQ